MGGEFKKVSRALQAMVRSLNFILSKNPVEHFKQRNEIVVIPSNSWGIYPKTPQWLPETKDSIGPYTYIMFFPICT